MPTDRAQTEAVAATVEHDHAERASDVEQLRVELAAVLEERLKAENRRVNRRFGVLFVATFLIFGLLSWRTELNADGNEATQHQLAVAFYQACTTRVERQTSANDGREILIAAATETITDPPLKAEQVRKLRAALLLPVETCGEPPS